MSYTYYQMKLEKIQYALECVRTILDGIPASDLVNYLEMEETKACEDLIIEEQANK